MSLQPLLIFCLVLAALLYAVALFLYRRKRMNTKWWYATIGAAIAGLLLFALLGLFGLLSQGIAGFLGVFTGAINIVSAWQWRPRRPSTT